MQADVAVDSPIFQRGLFAALRYPLRFLQGFEAAGPSLRTIPYATWAGLTAIAFLGSFVYGASLSLAVPDWDPKGGALWMALSAGLAWCVLGPTLVFLTRKSAFVLAHACLVTMSYGEGVLVTGALLNLLLAAGIGQTAGPGVFNIGWVGLSNVVMAVTLTRQLAAIGVSPWKTLLCWVFALNGSGTVFFYLFRSLLEK